MAFTDRSEFTPTISASPSRAGILKVSDVARVKDVEDAVGEHDRAPVMPQVLHQRHRLR